MLIPINQFPAYKYAKTMVAKQTLPSGEGHTEALIHTSFVLLMPRGFGQDLIFLEGHILGVVMFLTTAKERTSPR